MKVLFILTFIVSSLALDLKAKVISFNPKLRSLKDFYSKDMSLELEAEGLIQNLDSAYKFRLREPLTNQLFPLELISLSEKELKLKFPLDIDYGDYLLDYKFKSLYLKTPWQSLRDLIKLRPPAIQDFKLNADLILDISHLDLLISTDKQINSLSYILNESEIDISEITSNLNLSPIEAQQARERMIITNSKAGLNSIKIYNYDRGYKSIASVEKSFFYLPVESFEEELLIKTNPLKATVKNKFTGEYLDLTSILKVKNEDLKNTYFLNALENPFYLAKTIAFSALKIDKMKVVGDEHASLLNLGSLPFRLKKCNLADGVRIRFEFTQDIDLAAGSSLVVKGDLGLNNTGADFLKLSCIPENSTDLKYAVLDEFSYSKTDAEGFAVRD